MTYLITFSCYGSHLHGDPRGSVDRDHNQPGGPACCPSPARQRFEREAMTQSTYLLDKRRRDLVLQGILAACDARGWKLFAAHVRENHVHVVVEAPCPPEKAAHGFKAYASKLLNVARIDAPDRKRWARHYSARSMTSREARERAIQYVATKQGEPMALYVAQERVS